MSFSIIAPSILAGLPIPVPVEIKEPTDFMKFMVKHYHAAREIDKLNFFLNTQEPGLIFDAVGGGHNGPRTRYAGWANSYQKNGRNKLRVHARSVPSHVYDVRDPLFRSFPYPFGVPVLGAPLFGTSGDKFGVQSVVGPNGLIIPVKQSQPIGTDGKPLNSGFIMPFGRVGNPFPGMLGFPGMMGLRISRRDGSDGSTTQTDLCRQNVNAILDFMNKVTSMHTELTSAAKGKATTPDITARIGAFATSITTIQSLGTQAVNICNETNAGDLSKGFSDQAKSEHDRIKALKDTLLTEINRLSAATTSSASVGTSTP
jgi:hypothetical protein